MIYTIYPCPVSFCLSVSYCPHIILPPIVLPPWKSFNDFCYLPMSCIILPPGFILPPYYFAPHHFAPPPPPPGNLWICTIYQCPVSFCPPIILPPYHFAPHPIILPPGNCFIIYTIYLYPVSFCPLDSFSPHIILPPGPGNGLLIYTIYPCPVSFCHCIRLRFHTNKKPFTTKAYDRRASSDCGTSGYILLHLIKHG